jgi:Alpha amylase, catalytic domain
MLPWPKYPTLYEINTWVWLWDLSRKYGKTLHLGAVPSAEWDAIAAYGFDAVWLMGVWERSPASAAISNQNSALVDDFRRALPDFQPEDNVGSAYSVRRYEVDQHLGGTEGLAAARKELAQRGLRLVLDFVPNHVATDHPWGIEHPEYFIPGSAEDAKNDPTSYIEVEGTVYACGKDPYFPAWQDVLQLNAFRPELRTAAIETLSLVAGECDGVRCDMAMLLLNAVFARTWGARAGPMPQAEYWREVIPATRKVHPDFLFIAEAYWDLEWELQQQGFDFCYDKKLYDRLVHESAESVLLHLCADLSYQEKLLRFMENHDEPRAAATFSLAKEKAVALTMATLPGARLFHEGQFEGRKVRVPVFLRRRVEESADEGLLAFYARLLTAIDQSAFREGQWNLCERTGWPDNPSFQSLIAWSWMLGDVRYLIAVNLSDNALQARVRVPWDDVRGKPWRLTDALCDAIYDREGDEIAELGLYIELGAWGYNLFECRCLVDEIPKVDATAAGV